MATRTAGAVSIAALNIALIVFLETALDDVVGIEKNTSVLIESSPNGILLIDEHGKIQLVNGSTEKLFGYARDALLGKNVEILVPETAVEKHRKLREGFQLAPEARLMGVGRDLRGRRSDGSEFPVEIGLNPVSRDGRRSLLATIVDISLRKRVEQNHQLLIRELRHRTTNIFAVVSAIANKSLENRTITQGKHILNARLRALAQAYEVVAETGWEGASLREILDRKIAGFSDRVCIDGCDLTVSVSAAQQFGLIAHELATNALKYGALSQPDGRVTISGSSISNGTFLFRWLETGGPPVTPPLRKGFGGMILSEVAGRFGEHVRMEYPPDGFRYELEVSLDAVQARGGSKEPTASEHPTSTAA